MKTMGAHISVVRLFFAKIFKTEKTMCFYIFAELVTPIYTPAYNRRERRKYCKKIQKIQEMRICECENKKTTWVMSSKKTDGERGREKVKGLGFHATVLWISTTANSIKEEGE